MMIVAVKQIGGHSISKKLNSLRARAASVKYKYYAKIL